MALITRRSLILAALAIVSILAPPAFDAHAASAATCVTKDQTQMIDHLRGVSCAEARSVAARARSVRDNLPECAGSGVVRINGWTIRGVGRSGKPIATRFSRAGTSFRLSGGGLC